MASDSGTVTNPPDRAGQNPPFVRLALDERLTAALGAAAHSVSHANDGPPLEHEELRSAVCDFVARARARRIYPESVLVSLKEHVQRSEVSRSDRATNEAMVARVVHWAIEEYYRES